MTPASPKAAPEADAHSAGKAAGTSASARRGTGDRDVHATGFPIVGIGASAGGLEALEQFFANMPTESGMAFVVVTHQLVGHTSMMPEFLRRHTDMPVSGIERQHMVEPNHVYIAPPGPLLAIHSGVLSLHDNDSGKPVRHPIDYFVQSLAQERQELAVAIVLSGNGTDGTGGIKAIKAAAGLVMVQDEESARYSGMPHSAIATGIVDYVCPAVDMGKKLLAFVPGLSGMARQTPADVEHASDEVIRDLFEILHNRAGHDFSHYKKTTLMRRIDRRMAVHKLTSPRAYVEFLKSNPDALDALFNELLIGVTSFFRDPEAFESLRENALPALLDAKAPGQILRAWVTGCSTGEEAYSLAILIREYLDAHELNCSVQIFATDIDDAAIDVARAGVYPARIESDVSPERLERYFAKDENQCYRVKKLIREMVIFAPQNLLQDPSFTRLDLLTCRNLLIYLEAGLQQKVLPLFHFSLAENGILFLGSSESLGAASDLFEPVDKKWKIFRRKASPVERPVRTFPAEGLREFPRTTAGGVTKRPNARTEKTLERLAQEIVLPDYQVPSENQSEPENELAPSNRELQSANEELQSANEELETSKEEMQALNEELQTVNAELQAKMNALDEASDDMDNLLNSIDVATIFVDNRLRIKRFTETATKVVHLIDADIGRPLSDLVIQLRYDHVVEDAAEVLRTLNTREVEVASLDNRWYLMRILPYRTADNLIDGLVMTFADVTGAKDAYQFADSIVQSVRNPMLVLDYRLCVLSANRAFSATFGCEDDNLVASSIFKIGNGAWDILELHRLLHDVIAEQKTVEQFCVTHAFPGLGRITMELDARLLEPARGREAMKILLVFNIISKQRSGEHEVL